MAQDLYTYRNTASEPEADRGPLTGKRIIIQPNMSVRGWPATAGSVALENFTALEDATTIVRVRSAGASLVGSSRMAELGFGLFGETSGKVLRADEADIALVTDIMGEARLVAAASGLFGFKPSYAIVSRLGLIGLVPSMECYGVVAKNPEDIVRVMESIAGIDEEDFSMADRIPDFTALPESGSTLTAGVIKECIDCLNDKERQVFTEGLAKLEEAGITFKEVTFPDYDLFRPVHHVVASVEASSAAGKYDGVRYGHRSRSGKNWNEMYLNSRGESFGLTIKTFLFQGAYFQFEDYGAFENACRIRGRLARAAAEVIATVDLLVCPTLRHSQDPVKAATVNEVYEACLLTLPANVLGLPALHVPLSAADNLRPSSGGGPGLQLVASRLGDARLLSVGLKIACTMGKGNIG